jgi:SAM-dependent methyltransferase
MTPEQVAASYDRVAPFFDGPEFPRSNGIRQHERALGFVPEPGVALDIGCGSSGRIIDLLIDRGFEVEGLDVSSEMLRLAGRRHPGVQFFKADICAWEFPRSYDFISAWDSIWHVPLPEQLSVLRKLCRGLKDRGVLIFTTGGVEAPGEVTNQCLGQPMYTAAPGIPSVLRTLEESGCSCRHLEYDQYPEKHVYLIAQRS